MKPPAALSYDVLMDRSVSLVNLRRLARSLGLSVGKWEGVADERHQIARLIGKWYKSHPAPKRKRSSKRDRLGRG